MGGCFVSDCGHFFQRDRCKRVLFPQDETLRRKWIDSIRRGDKEPTATSYVCICHFPNKDSKQLPTLFERNRAARSLFSFVSPEKRKRKKRNIPEVQIEDEMEVNTPINDEETVNDNVGDVLQPDGETESHMKDKMVQTGHSCRDEFVQTENSYQDEMVQTDNSYQDEMVQTDHSFGPQFYEAEIYLLQEEMKKLRVQNDALLSQSFTFQSVTSNEDICYHYTGLQPSIVLLLDEYLSKVNIEYASSNVRVMKLDRSTQLLLTLTKLRRNLSYKDLAFRLRVSESTIQICFTTILKVLHELLFEKFMKKIPSRRKNQMFLPECFHSFRNCRVVMDCTEIPCDVPTNLDKQKLTFSSYKWYNSLKWLICCAPNGAVTFCSKAYPGSTADKTIVEHCGIVEQLEFGDLVLADKGFLISDVLPPGVTLNIPPFLWNPQFTVEELMECRRVARGRVHIERINVRLKKFKILDYIPHKLFPSVDLIMQVCCALVNLQAPILSECTDFFKNL